MSTPAHLNGITLHWYDDPAAFLSDAREVLAADPVVSNVVGAVTSHYAEHGTPPSSQPIWWVLARDAAGHPVGAAMRTMSTEPYAAFVLPMPAPAAAEIAEQLHGRGETLSHLNGARPATDQVAARLAELTGGTPRVIVHTRIFEIREVIPPAPVSGTLTVASAEDRDLVHAWTAAFAADADAQAGREPSADPVSSFDPELVDQEIDDGLVELWRDPAGAPVSLVARTAPMLGVVRLGPVFTPPGHRGNGWASAAVAQISERELGAGHRVCLFTDQANPVSNAVYERLGYRPVTDMVNLAIDPGRSAL